MKRKPWRIIGIATYLILAASSILGLAYGAILPSTTVFIYLTLFVVATATINYFIQNAETRKNTLLLVATTLCMLLATEFVLRYALKPQDCLNYTEKNGKMYYRSLTLRQAYSWLTFKSNLVSLLKHKLKKPEVKTEYNYKYSYNSMYIRGAEWPKEKQAGTKRIIVLGDSFAEGEGAPADSTWPALLQQILNVNGEHTQVLNAGIAGSDPYYELKLLQTQLLAYKPDMVIMAINKSDINDIAMIGGNERFVSDTTIRIKEGPWWEPIYGASMILRLIVHRVLHYNYNLLTQAQQAQRETEAHLLLNAAIDNLQALGAKQNFKPIVIFHPLLAELQNNENPLAPTMEHAVQQDIKTIDLYMAYRSYFATQNQSAANYYWPIDLHHNSNGYHLFAHEVAKQISEQP